MTKVRTVDEVGAILHRHPQTVRKLIRDGRLRALQDGPGGRVLVRDDDLDAYLDSIRLDPTPRPIATVAPDPSPGRDGRRSGRRRAS